MSADQKSFAEHVAEKHLAGGDVSRAVIEHRKKLIGLVEHMGPDALGMLVPTWSMQRRIVENAVSIQNLQILLPNDDLLVSFCGDNPRATIAQLTNMCKRRRRAGDCPSVCC
eukprot:s225_g29.t1